MRTLVKREKLSCDSEKLNDSQTGKGIDMNWIQANVIERTFAMDVGGKRDFHELSPFKANLDQQLINYKKLSQF